jgi:hypothetical protein
VEGLPGREFPGLSQGSNYSEYNNSYAIYIFPNLFSIHNELSL